MRLKHMVIVVAAMMGAAACNSTTSAVGSADERGKKANGVATESEATSANKIHAASSLQSLLNVLATPNAATWSAFETVPGVHWRDSAPRSGLHVAGPNMPRHRIGTLLLTGFGEVDVPDGKLGAEAGIRKDNEGNVGVTLNGDAIGVRSVALIKFYPSKNYEEIIQNQLNGSVTIKVIANMCELDYGTTASNTQMNTFYQIDLGPRFVPIFAEVYVDEAGGNQGPGYTYFEFYRDKPQQRMTAMHCNER